LVEVEDGPTLLGPRLRLGLPSTPFGWDVGVYIFLFPLLFLLAALINHQGLEDISWRQGQIPSLGLQSFQNLPL